MIVSKSIAKWGVDKEVYSTKWWSKQGGKFVTNKATLSRYKILEKDYPNSHKPYSLFIFL